MFKASDYRPKQYLLHFIFISLEIIEGGAIHKWEEPGVYSVLGVNLKARLTRRHTSSETSTCFRF